MHVKELSQEDRKKYEKWLNQNPFADIHQTWEWGVFQASDSERGKFFIVAALDDDNEIVASALVIRQKLPFNKSWFFIPRGPVMDYRNPPQEKRQKILTALFKKIEDVARAQNGVFLRFEPPLSSDYPDQFIGLRAHPAHAHYQPESTLVVDLKHPSEELLKLMKPKGRYNIKVAQKHEVKIRISDGNQKDTDTFYKLFSETTERDKFAGHSQKYYAEMLKVLGGERAKLYLAEYGGKPAAAAIITYFKDTATYYFGASSAEHRNVMAPYLLHWQALTDAKNAGFHYYDFFGIAPEGSQNHPWAKVTEFKLKFGGDRINYAPAREIIYRPFWYWLIRLAKKILQIIRR
jgi:peptidoglycan pentaglycine glycine transferase (the first glycine)